MYKYVCVCVCVCVDKTYHIIHLENTTAIMAYICIYAGVTASLNNI